MANPNEQHATRRDLLKAAGAVVASQLVAVRGTAAAAPPSAAFFSPEEFSLVEELTELIIPTDEHSPGARAAYAAAFIDKQLHETVADEVKSQWRDGLQRIDAQSRQMHGADFLKVSPEQRVAVLTRIAQNEENPLSPEERFFVELKSRTAFAYYTSTIGIHTEMEYKGNVYQEEFAGFDAEPLKRE